jgi:hypothetical protein
MNCRRTALFILLVAAVGCDAWSQLTVTSRGDTLKEWMKREEYFDRIDRKLERDVASTAVKIAAIDVDRFPLKGPIPTSDGNTVVLTPLGTYELLYLVHEGDPFVPSQFEIIPLGIRSQTVAGAVQGLKIGRQAVGGVSYSLVVHLKDIARLNTNDQRRIVDYIVQESANNSEALFVPAALNPMQPLFPNHRDFWSFAKVTSPFPVPLIEKNSGRRITGRIAGRTTPLKLPATGATPEATTTDSAGAGATVASGPAPEGNGDAHLGYTLDLSFSKIAAAHELLYSETALGIPGFGVEVGFDDPVLNLMPYQSPAISWGGRLLLNTTGEKGDILDRDFMELKLFGRSRFNAHEFSRTMGGFKYLFTPLVTSETPTLNVAVPGYGFEIRTSKWWNLPYLNFYYAGGSRTYTDPVYGFGPEAQRYAYWSTIQWRGSMSFYFNLDSQPEFYIANSSGKRLNTVRLDLGVGTYNVARVGYDSAGGVASSATVLRTSRVQPYVAAEYAHASQVKTAFGAKAVYFDNRVILTLWLSLFKLGNHELRVEGTDIVGPFGRARFEWETAGGAFMQFRYRLGF